MTASIIAIADAVTTQLNATTFSQSFTAQRHYLPTFELSSMSNLHVSVVPKGISSTSLDRNRDSFEYTIDLAIQKKTGLDTAVLDELMLLVEEIADHFRSQGLLSFPAARCVNVENVPVYAPEHLQEFRQFTSVLTLTFRLWK